MIRFYFYVSIAALIFTGLISCEEITENPGKDIFIEIDTIISKDALHGVDTCIGDTCYTCNLSEPAQVLYDQLMLAYRDSCVSCLEDMLIDWSEASVPESNIPDSLKDVYAVYKEFYSPWDLKRIADSEFGHSIYQGISYYIIQSAITYDTSFRSWGGTGYTVSPFRPSITNDTIRLLYLDGSYPLPLNCFLGADYVPVGSDNIMTPAFPAGESYNRYRFLANFLLIFHGHWGNYWHLETHPEVERISFNARGDSAQVHFRLGYQGGEVILGKDAEGWNIVDHYMTWIE